LRIKASSLQLLRAVIKCYGGGAREGRLVALRDARARARRVIAGDSWKPHLKRAQQCCLLTGDDQVAPTPAPDDSRRLDPAILDAAADPASARTHPITLKFASPELETAFKEQYQLESPPVRRREVDRAIAPCA